MQSEKERLWGKTKRCTNIWKTTGGRGPAKRRKTQWPKKATEDGVIKK